MHWSIAATRVLVWKGGIKGTVKWFQVRLAWQMDAFFVRKDGRVAKSRRITGGQNGVYVLRLTCPSESDINSSAKEELILSAVDTWMCHSRCHSQR